VLSALPFAPAFLLAFEFETRVKLIPRLVGRIIMNMLSKTVVLPPSISQTLKHYRLDGVIGEGGMGVVYRTQYLKLQWPVAIKLLPTMLMADAKRQVLTKIGNCPPCYFGTGW
jgi:serine/threonine protein kinase